MLRKLFSDCASRFTKRGRGQKPLLRHTGWCVGQKPELNKNYLAYLGNRYACGIGYTVGNNAFHA